MHDILFENQESLGDQRLAQYASELGLDAASLIDEVRAGRYAGRIQEDLQGGLSSGVNGTPTFFINGLRYDGDDDVESLLEALEKANASQSRKRAVRKR